MKLTPQQSARVRAATKWMVYTIMLLILLGVVTAGLMVVDGTVFGDVP